MAQETREEDLRNSLVYFTDARGGKDTRRFGIDLGPGSPKNTRQVAYGLMFFNHSTRTDVILLDENNPLVTVQEFSFAEFLVRARRILKLASQHHSLFSAAAISYLLRGVPFVEMDFDKDANIIEKRLEETYTIHTLDWLNTLISELIQKGVTDF